MTNLLLCVEITWPLVVLICSLALIGVVYFLFREYLKMKYFTSPSLKYFHELDLKNKAFEHEKHWFYLRRMEEPMEKELEKCKNELGELKQKEKEINSLKQEKNDFRITILEEKIKIYEEVIKNIRG